MARNPMRRMSRLPRMKSVKKRMMRETCRPSSPWRRRGLVAMGESPRTGAPWSTGACREHCSGKTYRQYPRATVMDHVGTRRVSGRTVEGVLRDRRVCFASGSKGSNPSRGWEAGDGSAVKSSSIRVCANSICVVGVTATGKRPANDRRATLSRCPPTPPPVRARARPGAAMFDFPALERIEALAASLAALADGPADGPPAEPAGGPGAGLPPAPEQAGEDRGSPARPARGANPEWGAAALANDRRPGDGATDAGGGSAAALASPAPSTDLGAADPGGGGAPTAAGGDGAPADARVPPPPSAGLGAADNGGGSAPDAVGGDGAPVATTGSSASATTPASPTPSLPDFDEVSLEGDQVAATRRADPLAPVSPTLSPTSPAMVEPKGGVKPGENRQEETSHHDGPSGPSGNVEGGGEMPSDATEDCGDPRGIRGTQPGLGRGLAHAKSPGLRRAKHRRGRRARGRSLDFGRA